MTPLEAAKALAGQGAFLFLDFDTNGEPYQNGDPHATAHWMCLVCSVRQAFVDDADFVHESHCPSLALPSIVAALEAGDDLAGLLEMVLANQIRNGWVEEGSSELDVPCKVMARWATLRGKG